MNILVLEDNEIARIGLVALLKSIIIDDLKIFEFSEAKTCLAQIDSYSFDMAFIDLDLEDELVGFEILNKLKNSSTYNVILTGHEEENLITQAYELGAKDFIVKPIEESTLEAIIHRRNIEQSLEDEISGKTSRLFFY